MLPSQLKNNFFSDSLYSSSCVQLCARHNSQKFISYNWTTFLDLHYLYFSDFGQHHPIQYMFYGYDPVDMSEQSDGSQSLASYWVLRPVVGLHEGGLYMYAYSICTRLGQVTMITRRGNVTIDHKQAAYSFWYLPHVHNKGAGPAPTSCAKSPHMRIHTGCMAVPCQCSQGQGVIHFHALLGGHDKIFRPRKEALLLVCSIVMITWDTWTYLHTQHYNLSWHA